MIVVTGGSGFIGSALVRSLLADGHDVLVVDDVDASGPWGNLFGLGVRRVGQDAFLASLGAPGALHGVDAVLHQGACSSTTVDDEAFLTANNLEWSVAVLDACQRAEVPLVYASSASVYGVGPDFVERLGHERPLNAYARSKARVDQVVAHRLDALTAPVVGLRYFNVYGPGERHKGAMASQALQLFDQVRADGVARIFGAGAGAEAGMHRRDFVHVDDVVAVVRWFLAHPERSGVFNCGTGVARTFQDLAELVVAGVGSGRVEHVPFPERFLGRYQAHTEADLALLRSAGCDVEFATLEEGVGRYVEHLLAEPTR